MVGVLMPLRDFLCNDDECGHVFEAIQKEDEIIPCPKCNCTTERLLSAPGGYQISGNNSGSTRPRYASSFRRGEKK